MRYGFNGVDIQGKRLLDRLKIDFGYHGDQTSIIDVDVPFNVRVIMEERPEGGYRYSYLMEGDVRFDPEAGVAAFYMDNNENVLHGYPNEEQEYWINRLKERKLQQWEVLPY